MCKNVQSIGAISASNRGFDTIICEPNNCVYCGQCVQVCPTGALMQVDDTYLVEEALKQPGVIGARMTGAGFGGCAVSIVEETEVTSFIENVAKAYEAKIGYAADFYVVEIGDGPRVL